MALRVKGENENQERFLFLATLLRVYLKLTGEGRLLVNPFPMIIDRPLLAYEPEMMIVLSENLNRIQLEHLNGAADIVIEIISDSTSATDRGEKFVQYEACGVREYWFIDPARREFSVNLLGDDGWYHTFSHSYESHITSSLLSAFKLKPQILWREEFPAKFDEFNAIFREMAVIQ